jgi:hypothetical protein
MEDASQIPWTPIFASLATAMGTLTGAISILYRAKASADKERIDVLQAQNNDLLEFQKTTLLALTTELRAEMIASHEIIGGMKRALEDKR